MLVPSTIRGIAPFCAAANARYAFAGIQFARSPDGRPRALATDGRRAIRVTWDEPAAGRGEPVGDFATTLPIDAVNSICKAAGGTPSHPRHFAIDEPSANGTVRLATTVTGAETRSEVKSVDGTFPPVLDVFEDRTVVYVNAKPHVALPSDPPVDLTLQAEPPPASAADADAPPAAVAQGAQGAQGGPTSDPERWAVTMCVNAKFLRDALDALTRTTGTTCVKLTVPLQRGRAMQVDPLTTPLKVDASAIIMPVHDAPGERMRR